jgi:uncharacterized protein YcnI
MSKFNYMNIKNYFRKMVLVGGVLGIVSLLLVVSVSSASAHVVVKPNQVNVGAFQTFSIGVPVEQNIPTVGIRLVIPEGLAYVTPNVKPGWKITTKTIGEGEAKKVTEIIWTGGSIPAGQRDDFVFSAKVPTTASSISWKAYQTYQNGTVVAWDHDPAEKITDFSTMGPYSVTTVVDDLATTTTSSKSIRDGSTYVISIVAFVFSIIALGRTRRMKDQ